MKNKSLMLLMVAAGCGLVAMFGVQQMMSTGPSTPKSRILVARTEIDAGVQLDKTNVGFKEWPADAMPQGAIRTEEEFAERALKHRVVPGQPILMTELGNKGEFGMQIQIPAGMRVVSYPVTATMTHSGLMKPGNFVDISAVIEAPVKGGGKRTEVKPVLQCVQVFAVDRRIVGSEETKDAKANEGKNISFLVYPLQGQLLQLAYKQSNGGLQFALRSGADKDLVNSHDLSDESMSMLSNSLLGHQEDRTTVAEKPSAPTTVKPKSAFRSYLAPETPAVVTAVGDQAAKRTWKIEIFQGDQREVQEIDWPEEATTDAKPTSNDAGNPVLKLYNRRDKGNKPNTVEAKSTSLVRQKDATESTTDDSEKVKEVLEEAIDK